MEIVGPYQLNKFLFDELNDKLRAIEMYTYDETDLTDARVTIFGYKDFALPYAGTFTVGGYKTSDLVAHHVGAPGHTYAGKGIRVPSGLSAVVYLEDSFAGTSLTLNGPITRDFTDTNTNFNGKIASLRVFLTGKEEYAVTATWVQIPYSSWLSLVSIPKQLITNPEDSTGELYDQLVTSLETYGFDWEKEDGSTQKVSGSEATSLA